MPHPLPLRWLPLLAIAACARAAQQPIDYNRDIRPLLSENCFACHGQDAAHRKGELRLDDPAEARRPHDGHAAIVPGDVTASTLVAHITSTDPDELMPPPDSHRELSAEQVALLTRWVAQGATYQAHWAFQRPLRPDPPAVRDAAWPRGPLDRFIAARLDAQGLAPAPAAEPATWLRRAAFDLTGLPPSPAELDAFATAVAARGEAAFAAVVDRLLASPRYGERMAQDWLDVARYGDTHGFNNDSARSMWRWRDWVIAAFNADLPYDRFITEQLAGDLLPRATIEQRIATGFGRNHVINSEGGIIAEEYRVEYVADRVRTLGLAWLGLTIECARCHDHKFDPLPQRDYYRLFAFFDNLDESGEDGRVANAAPLMAAPTAAQQQRLAELDAGIASADRDLAVLLARAGDVPRTRLDAAPAGGGPDPEPTLELGVRDCAGGLRNLRGGDAEAVPGGTGADGADPVLGTILAPDAQGLLLAEHLIDLAKPWTFAAWVRWDGGDGALFSSMDYRGNPAAGGWGKGNEVRVTAAGAIEVRRADTWPFYAFQVVTRETLEPGAWQHVVVTCSGTAAQGARVYIDGDERGVTVLRDDLTSSPGGTPRLGSDSEQAPAHLRGRLAGVRFHDRALAPAEITAWSAAQLARLGAAGAQAVIPASDARLRALALRLTDPAFAARWDARADLRATRCALERDLPTTMVMAEMAQPRQAAVLIRGRYDAPGEAVAPDVPAALGTPWPADAPRNRLGLAQWLTSPAQPLTARVVVNRFWQQLFGTGLVKTVEDFGHQGEYPSHPELLDWLASGFVASGWDVKALLRQIVLSATYRQSAVASPALRERDPENRLLARGPRRRLTAEMIRDQALAVSGLLAERVGGPSVFPYQPADLYTGVVVDAPYPGTRWTVGSGEDLRRRSLYTFWKRTVPHPVLSVFDAPEREVCSARRSSTDTPLQALTLMNETGFVEAARLLAARMLREGGASDDARLSFAFRLCTARAPAPAEAAVLSRVLARMRADYLADPAAAARLLQVGAAPLDDVAPVPELAAHAAVAGMLLNLDETINRD
jgi:mono/diheme cytochrome c family protein